MGRGTAVFCVFSGETVRTIKALFIGSVVVAIVSVAVMESSIFSCFAVDQVP
jgi:hypothetical protein